MPQDKDRLDLESEELIAEDKILLSDRALRRLSVEEFLVDFLGGLIPGILFLAASATIVFPVAHAILRQQQKATHAALEDAILAVASATKETPNALWFGALIIILLIAYVVGHLFYRHDPNGPDARSFRWLARKREYRDKELKLNFIKRGILFVLRPWELDKRDMLLGDLACANARECQFPYVHYDAYLKKRGLDDLLSWTKWTESETRRTKNYINRLKILLRQRHPEKCASILRNEAHVRLATSTWYVSGALLFMSSGGIGCLLLLVLGSTGPHVDRALSAMLGSFLSAFVCCLTVLVFSLYSRISIAKFLHYQRMREVFFVIETARVALRRAPTIGPLGHPSAKAHESGR
jgi:hypothetical protein